MQEQDKNLDLPPAFESSESEYLDLGGVAIHGTKSERRELFAALAKAQAGFQPIKKDTENTFFKSKYAPLENVLEAVRPALAANGLFFSQPLVDGANGSKELHCILTHAGGATMHAVVVLPGWQKVQDLGSVITYMRRYTAQAFFGVNAETDDDGNAASGREVPAPQEKRRQPEPKSAPQPAKSEPRPEPPSAPEHQEPPANDGLVDLMTAEQSDVIKSHAKRLGWGKIELTQFAKEQTGMTSANMTRAGAIKLTAALEAL